MTHIPGKQRQGQSSVEYLAITVGALAVFTPIAFFAFNALQSNTAATASSQAAISVEQLGDAADTVCSLPNGTKQELTVSIPVQVDASRSGFGVIHPRTLHFSVETPNQKENITAVTTCNVTGTFPNRTGPVRFEIRKQAENQVHFTAE